MEGSERLSIERQVRLPGINMCTTMSMAPKAYGSGSMHALSSTRLAGMAMVDKPRMGRIAWA